MNVYNHILNVINKFGAAYFILIDPDKLPSENLKTFLKTCEESEIDGLLIGGSLMINNNFHQYIDEVKRNTKLPIIIFPSGVEHLSKSADAVLFISLISGRNPEFLIGKHISAAPIVKQLNLETISTGYILIDSGSTTTVEYISGTFPIPRNKNEIAIATALAGQYLGMKFIYLEAGSGADNYVPFEMIKSVTSSCEIPIIVGGGIKSPQVASQMVANGAKIIVTGNHFEDESKWHLIKDFAKAIHYKKSIIV
ncbi:MAG: geranylgeranylglyceryl/heptaprenylglyceryl phosphate synthase [Ignavibacterium sp.]